MSTECRAVLDACVLIPMPLADTLLRMAEEPRLYAPQWTRTILDEVTRNLIAKWGMRRDRAERRETELNRHFPEAIVDGFEPLLDKMTNDPGDRHVLAAAVHCRADVVVTYNRRHFPTDSLRRWNIEVHGPSAFLRRLFDLDATSFVSRLDEQATAIGVSPQRLLRSLHKNVPSFVDCYARERQIVLGDE